MNQESPVPGDSINSWADVVAKRKWKNAYEAKVKNRIITGNLSKPFPKAFRLRELQEQRNLAITGS